MRNRGVERWAGRLGVILTVAGSAIGLGSFLCFPTEVARYGGSWGRHNLPGIFNVVTRRPRGKYLGVLGLYVPFILVVYYLYVESWTLGYTFISAIGQFTPAKEESSHVS